jgi:hypothetical protein
MPKSNAETATGVTVKDIIDAAGGKEAIAQKCNLTTYGVERWVYLGIPPKYWDQIRELIRELTGKDESGITINEFFQAGQRARSRNDEQ